MRYSSRAQSSIRLANQEAARLNHDHISTGHLLLGLMREGEGTAITFLKGLNIELEKMKAELETALEKKGRGSIIGQMRFTTRASSALELAAEESQNLGHKYVGTEHLLVGIIRDQEGVASKILKKYGVDLEKSRNLAKSVVFDEEERFETMTMHNAKTTVPAQMLYMKNTPIFYENEVLDLEQASKFLGINIAEMNKLVESEDLPARMIGGQWRFSRSALIRWLGEGRSGNYIKKGNENH